MTIPDEPEELVFEDPSPRQQEYGRNILHKHTQEGNPITFQGASAAFFAAFNRSRGEDGSHTL